MQDIDISELESKAHNLSEYYDKIEVEKIPTKNSYILHIYWESDRSKLDLNNCFLENNGKQWAICVKIDMSEEELYEGNNKPMHEVVYIPEGIEKIVVDRIRPIGKFLLNGYESNAGVPDKIW